jgi:hypothetical protein
MKKITLLAVAALAISFASCKKDRACECTQTSNGVTIVSTTTVKSGKKDAESWCSASTGGKTTVTVNGVAATGNTTSGATCVIK